MTYAENTSVTESRSREEIEQLLRRHGASRFGAMTDFDLRKAIVAFTFQNIAVQMEISLPDPKDRKFTETPARRHKRSPRDAALEYEAEIRRRWRSLCLCIKSKLVAVADGIATFEAEFLPYMVTADGKTIAQKLLPVIEAAKKSGGIPAGLLITGPGE